MLFQVHLAHTVLFWKLFSLYRNRDTLWIFRNDVRFCSFRWSCPASLCFWVWMVCLMWSTASSPPAGMDASTHSRGTEQELRLSILKCLCWGFHNRTKKGLLCQVEDYYISKGHCQPAIVNSRNKTRATVNQLISQYLHCHQPTIVISRNKTRATVNQLINQYLYCHFSGEKMHTHEVRYGNESSHKSHACVDCNINRLTVYKLDKTQNT